MSQSSGRVHGMACRVHHGVTTPHRRPVTRGDSTVAKSIQQRYAGESVHMEGRGERERERGNVEAISDTNKLEAHDAQEEN
jgi:hypothetical protein